MRSNILSSEVSIYYDEDGLSELLKREDIHAVDVLGKQLQSRLDLL